MLSFNAWHSKCSSKNLKKFQKRKAWNTHVFDLRRCRILSTRSYMAATTYSKCFVSNCTTFLDLKYCVISFTMS